VALELETIASIRSLIDGFFDGPSADNEIREQLYQKLHESGAEALLEELRLVDPLAAAGMHPTNTRRIIRALEVYKLTGSSISELHEDKIDINFQPVLIGLEWNRKNHGRYWI